MPGVPAPYVPPYGVQRPAILPAVVPMPLAVPVPVTPYPSYPEERYPQAPYPQAPYPQAPYPEEPYPQAPYGPAYPPTLGMDYASVVTYLQTVLTATAEEIASYVLQLLREGGTAV